MARYNLRGLQRLTFTGFCLAFIAEIDRNMCACVGVCPGFARLLGDALGRVAGRGVYFARFGD